MINLTLRDLVLANGGFKVVAEELNITPRALYKWAESNRLPRTEYTEETTYSQKLSNITGVPADDIKKMCRPGK